MQNQNTDTRKSRQNEANFFKISRTDMSAIRMREFRASAPLNLAHNLAQNTRTVYLHLDHFVRNIFHWQDN